MKPTTRAKRERATTDPSYEELAESLRESTAEVERLRQRNQELERKLAALEASEPEATLTEDEVQGQKWRKFFLTSDIFREHIEPKLEEPWRAILLEACGQAVSKTEAQIERKTMDASDATRSVALYEWCLARGYERQIKHNYAHVTKVQAARELDFENPRHTADYDDEPNLSEWRAGDEQEWERAFTMQNAVSWGDVALVKLLHESGYPWHDGACAETANKGRLDMLKYLHENGCPWDAWTCKGAAKGGHLDGLKYAHENGCPWNEWTCAWAANGGYLDVHKYAHENGCPWDEMTCYYAARGGHLDVLKYTNENGCPWNERTCSLAAKGGHLDMLIYAHENGCPWDRFTCSNAAEGGHLDVLKYAHENGCPWGQGTCTSAASAGHLDVLKYARENKCPWNRKTCRTNAEKRGHDAVVEWIDSCRTTKRKRT